ncbi:MAG: HlyD family secretion protein [Bacteroidota bacterium]
MEPQQEKKFPVKLIVIGAILLTGIFFGFKKVSYAIAHETTDNAQIETQITPVLTRVSGYVKTLAIQDYDSVKSNQLLVELDDAELQNQLAQMEADYVQTEADITNANASLQNAIISLSVNKGNIEVSNVKLQQATTEYNRNKNLYAEQAITEKQLDDSKYNYQVAQKAFDNTKNDLSSAQSRIAVLESMVKKNEATLKFKKTKIDEVKLKISYTKIYAPSTGKIGKKNVSEGQFVQAGSPLFTIINDTAYWVTANFKENQLKNLTPGKEVELEIDAFPDEKITGIIESVSEATGAKFAMLPPDNSSGNFVKVTQRVPVKIKIKNAEQYKHALRAGLSVFVSAPIK